MDIEKNAGSQPFLSGYPSLAAFIASGRDQTPAIFKRFNRLAARHLLHLQSELIELQARQDQLDWQESHGSIKTRQFSRNWAEFSEAAVSDPRQKQSKALAKEIGKTLKEYREALFYESYLASLPRPTKRSLSTIYDDPDDLVGLRAEDRDRLTAFLQDYCPTIFRTHREQNGIIYAYDYRVARFVTILSTINVAALLVGAIVSLYAIRSPKTKLGIVALFTAIFSINVGVLTNSRRIELFAATGVYAAVLVVFVSGNLGADNNGRNG